MKKLIQSVILLLLAFNVSYGQNLEKYSKLIKEANDLYQSKDFAQAAEKYSEAFVVVSGNGKVFDRYNAACSWALANEIDSAFVHIFNVAEIGKYSNLDHISKDPDFTSLHEDERWNKVLELIKANKEKAEANFDKPLIASLDTIYQEDQKYRQQVKEVEDKYGRESVQMKAHWEIINKKDSINLRKVKKILDERGWLGSDVISRQGNLTVFLVIQHADQKTQEKYLPMMREAAKKGNANPSNLALLEDRVAIGKGKKQIYGSQINRDPETGEYYVLPLEDPDKVDKRRAEVGLGTIQEYISFWGMTWNVKEYKKKLPQYIAIQKQSNMH
jgi:hypothetical protein